MNACHVHDLLLQFPPKHFLKAEVPPLDLEDEAEEEQVSEEVESVVGPFAQAERPFWAAAVSVVFQVEAAVVPPLLYTCTVEKELSPLA